MFVVLRYRPNVGEHGQFKFDLRMEKKRRARPTLRSPNRSICVGAILVGPMMSTRGQVDSVGL